MKKTNLSIAALSIAALSIAFLAQSAHATSANPSLSDFFQDWTLDTSQNNSAQCHSLLSSLPLGQIPGVNGIPGPGYDSSTGITFTFNDAPTGPYDYPAGTQDSLIISGTPSTDSSGNTSVLAKLSGNQLSTRSESFTLLSDGGLTYVSNAKKAKANCNYTNAHPSLVGKVQTGAILLIDGKKAAQCSFAPATPRPDQENFAYTESCSFGKYVLKSYITMEVETLKTVIEANPKAEHDMELVRSSDQLNASTENYLSRDTEILVVNSPGITLPPVDQLYPNDDEYFISPYETQTYTVAGASNAQIQFIYADQQ